MQLFERIGVKNFESLLTKNDDKESVEYKAD